MVGYPAIERALMKKIAGSILIVILLAASVPTQAQSVEPSAPKLGVLTDDQESYRLGSSPAQRADPWKLFVGPASRFGHILADQGLSSPDVWDIVQDSQGFIWFGTLDGLNRYDGYQMKVFRNDPDNPRSLSSNAIRKLYVDKQGVLWIGTWTGGLDQYDQGTESFIHYRNNPEDPTSLSSDSVFAIQEDSRGNLWIGTRGGGLNLFDPQTQTFQHFVHDPDDLTTISNDNVFAIVEDKTGALWIATDGGLNRYDPTAETFTAYRNDPSVPTSLNLDNLRALFLDGDRTLWIGTIGGGLDRFDLEQANAADPQSAVFIHFTQESDNPQSLTDNNVFSIYRDSQDQLWLGTLLGGINQYDPTSGGFRHEQEIAKPAGTFEAESVYSVVEAAGMVWFGTSNGVYTTDLQGKHFYNLVHDPSEPNSIPETEVDAAYQDSQEILWVSTVSSGLHKVDTRSGTITQYHHDPNNPNSLGIESVGKIAPSRDGGLWLALFGAGLDKFDPATGTSTHYHNDPNDPDSLASDLTSFVYEDTDGVVWVGTAGAGVDRLDPVTGKFSHLPHIPSDPESLGGDTVNTIYQASDGALWVGTLTGPLNRIDRQSLKISHLRPKAQDSSGLDSMNATAILEDRDHNLWVGTWGTGLYHVNINGTLIRRYTQRDGLANDTVFSIRTDERGLLWIATNDGISMFNSETGRFRNYDINDGLPGNSFDALVTEPSASGAIYFGGKGGLVMFNPEEIQDNPFVPPVQLTDFELNNKGVAIGSDSVLNRSIIETRDLTLSYEDRILTFEFAALSFVAPEKNRYRYKLEGFDGDWIEVGSNRRRVTYTNLDPGAYILLVLGSNNDGVWNEQGTSLNLVITPPWWETTGFRVTLGFLFLGLIAGGFALQRRRAEVQQHKLEGMVVERTLESNKANEKLILRLGWLYAVTRALQTITGHESLALQFKELSDKIRLLLNAELVLVYRWDDQGEGSDALSHAEDPQEQHDLDFVKALFQKESPLRREIELGKIVYYPSDQADWMTPLLGEHFPNQDITCFVFAPIQIGQHVIGVLGILGSAPLQNLILDEFDLIERMAFDLASLTQSAIFLEQALVLATVEERNRLARELHDSVTQTLFTASVLAEATPHIWERDQGIARQNMLKLNRLIRGALAEMRSMLIELRMGTLHHQTLEHLLLALVEGAQARSPSAINLSLAKDLPALPEKVMICFYRIAREAVTNATIHSGASRIDVIVSEVHGQMELRVQDDGTGFDAQLVPAGHMGLNIMKERAREIGVTITIQSTPGEGTTVRVAWPNQAGERTENG